MFVSDKTTQSIISYSYSLRLNNVEYSNESRPNVIQLYFIEQWSFATFSIVCRLYDVFLCMGKWH